MEKISVTEAYRELGNFLRRKGAQRIILLSAKEKENGREFQIVIEGDCDFALLEEEMRKKWPDDRMMLINRDEIDTLEEIQEMEQAGIIL